VWEKYVSERRNYHGRAGKHTFTHSFLRWDTGANSDAKRSVPRDAFFGRFIDGDVFLDNCNSSVLNLGASMGHAAMQSAESSYADPDRCAQPDS
jgi:hypothetical protein